VDEVVFGRYRLLSLIGEGGMGKVYKARDTMMDRDVAIKVLPRELATEPGYEERFRREAYMAARLTEPHIVPIHEAGEIDGRLYLVMPIIEGTDVHSLLKRDGPLSPERAVQVIEQLAAALDSAHEAGLVHRDIKPSNALMTRREFVYLIDFGIAHDASATRLTNTGMIVGTMAYMAPERFTTGTADARADIYALACVLYECLTGATPYHGDSMEQQIAGHLALDPPRPSTSDPAIPAGFDEVIAAGMAKSPDQRYQSAYDLATAARGALTQAPQAATPTPTPYPHTAPSRFADPNRAAADPTRAATGPTRAATPPPQQPQWPATTRQAVHRDQPGPRPSSGRDGQPRIGRAGKISLAVAAVALAGVVVAAIVANIPHSPSRKPAPTSYSSQIELQFAGLRYPMNVAVDKAGDVYVSGSDSQGNARLRKLAVGSIAPVDVPVAGLIPPVGMAFDNAGNLYLATYKRVLRVAAGSTTPTDLLTDSSSGYGGFSSAVAVDSAGNVYVCRNTQNQEGVLKIDAGSTTSSTLAITGLRFPAGVAVDDAGNVYVTDSYKNQVLKLPAGATTQAVLPITGLKQPSGVAADGWGSVYIAGANGVLKLPAGSSTAISLPFSGAQYPSSVAVDNDGNVYLVDGSYYLDARVIKLPAQPVH
jgi:serine/threonine protein kinase, bacterial